MRTLTMEAFFRDLRFGGKQLVRHPWMSLLAIVVLGLGIGSVTTQFSVLNTLLIKGLPFPDSHRLVSVERTSALGREVDADPLIIEFLEWQQRQDAFEGLAAFYPGTVNLSMGDHVERYAGCFLSGNTFELLRIQPALGRTLTAADDLPASPDVIVISHRVWQNDFAGDPDILGTKVVVNGRPAEIVGVLPERFAFPVREDVYVPLLKEQPPSLLEWGQRRAHIGVFGRLREGVSMEQATASMSVLCQQIAAEQKDTHEGLHLVHTQRLFDNFIGGQTYAMTAVMMLITILIMGIACANVANLLMTRSLQRRKETAIRSALGASRGRIISQFLTESLLISIIGAGIGIIQSTYDLRRINEARLQLNSPDWLDFSMDWRVYLVAIAATLVTALVSGITPALRASNLNESEVLKDTASTGTSIYLGRFTRTLVILQISVAAVILSLVVLFTTSMKNALSLEYAYNPDEVLSARIGLFENVYPQGTDRRAFISTLLTRLREHPEVLHAASTDRYEFSDISRMAYKTLDDLGNPLEASGLTGVQRVNMGFFEALQIPVLRGETFAPTAYDQAVPSVALVNEAFARRLWGKEDPIGKQFRANLLNEDSGASEWPLLEVVGVVPPMQEVNPFSTTFDGASIIIPQPAEPFPRFITLLVRGQGTPAEMIPILRGTIAELDPNLPLYAVGTPRERNNLALAQFEFFSSIFTIFGTITTLLAGLGIFGVMTFSVNQRIMEFGIRQAIGATGRHLFGLVYLHAMKQLLLGFLIALLLLSPLILIPGMRQSFELFFYGIHPEAISPYLKAFAFVAVVALLSVAPPALKAARIHPAEALRHD